MPYINYNPNPNHARVGDCAVRALARATGQDWKQTFIGLMTTAYDMCDMPSANNVWGTYLRNHGFDRHIVPSECPDCYTVEDFCKDHPQGTYVLALPSHVVAAVDGCWYDTWNSGEEAPLYYWEQTKKEDMQDVQQ